MASNPNRSAQPLGIGEYLFNEARHAVHDVRQKLFEEAWFGRVVTAEPVMDIFKSQERDQRPQASFNEAWGLNHTRPETPEQQEKHTVPEFDR